jgi:hypothetical protein
MTIYKVGQKMLRDRLSRIDKGEPIQPKRKSQITCGELYPEIKREYAIHRCKSLDSVNRRWRLHLEPWFADRAARNVDDDALAAYIDHRLEEKDNLRASIENSLA